DDSTGTARSVIAAAYVTGSTRLCPGARRAGGGPRLIPRAKTDWHGTRSADGREVGKMAETVRGARWFLLGVSLPALMLLGASPAHATKAKSTADTRAMLRCRKTVEREGYSYEALSTWRLLRCSRSLAECQALAAPQCPQAAYDCSDLAHDLAGLGLR